MNEQEYASLQDYRAMPTRLSASMLRNRVPRTLIWGFDCDRNSFHVYLGDDNQLHIVRYDYDGFLLAYQTEANAEPQAYVPNKRVYPGACDLEFCRILIDADVRIPFTTFEARPDETFFGKKREELIEAPVDYAVPVVVIAVEDFDFPQDAPVTMYRHIRNRFAETLPVQVAQAVDYFYRLVKFKKEDPEALRKRVMWRLQGIGNDIPGEYRDGDVEFSAYRYQMSDKARDTLVPRMMAVLQEAYKQ